MLPRCLREYNDEQTRISDDARVSEICKLRLSSFGDLLYLPYIRINLNRYHLGIIKVLVIILLQ